MERFKHCFPHMPSLYECVWEALDLIVIPPLIELSCQFLLPPCNKSQFNAAKHRHWDITRWEQAKRTIMDLSQFEACFANPTVEKASDSMMLKIPWLLLHYAVDAKSYQVANWLLSYGITEYHPIAMAVLDVLISQEFISPLSFHQTNPLVIELLFTWRVPLVIPGSSQPSINSHRFLYSRGFQYCLKACENADNPLLTTLELPLEILQECITHWLRSQQWTPLLVVLDQFESRMQFVRPSQRFVWLQHFAIIWQALPIEK